MCKLILTSKGWDKNELYMGPLGPLKDCVYNGVGFKTAAIRSIIEISTSISTLLIWILTRDFGMIDNLDCTACKSAKNQTDNKKRKSIHCINTILNT